MKFLLVLITLLPACAHSQVEGRNVQFLPVVRRDETSKQWCPEAQSGEVCKMNWNQAIEYCHSQGAHLPTAREYVNFLKPRNIQVLEKNEVQGEAPKDFYFVESLNPDGSYDAFYMNHKTYIRPANETENLLLWTASIPPAHQQYAHVYYTEWGGGGGNPKDHLLTARNGVQCVR